MKNENAGARTVEEMIDRRTPGRVMARFGKTQYRGFGGSRTSLLQSGEKVRAPFMELVTEESQKRRVEEDQFRSRGRAGCSGLARRNIRQGFRITTGGAREGTGFGGLEGGVDLGGEGSIRFAKLVGKPQCPLPGAASRRVRNPGGEEPCRLSGGNSWSKFGMEGLQFPFCAELRAMT